MTQAAILEAEAELPDPRRRAGRRLVSEIFLTELRHF